MNVALIGLDDILLRCARTLIDSGHTISRAMDVGPHLDALLSLAPGVQIQSAEDVVVTLGSEHWILAGSGTPSAAGEDQIPEWVDRATQLKRLVQEGQNLALVPLGCDLDIAYELELYRRDSQSKLVTIIEDWQHEGVRWIRELTQSHNTQLGNVKQIRWEVSQQNLSRHALQQALLRKFAFIRSWLGPIENVLATSPSHRSSYDPMGPKQQAIDLNDATIHLNTHSGIVATLSVVPAGLVSLERVSLLGDHGQAILLINEATESWSGEIQSDGKRSSLAFAPIPFPWNEIFVTDTTSTAVLPSWLDSCRDLELLEAVDRSVLRGRTVILNTVETSEDDAFKSLMASGGCLVLMLVLLGLFVVVMVEGFQIPLRETSLWKAWPIALVGIVLLFLAGQSLRILTTSPRASDENSGKNSEL